MLKLVSLESLFLLHKQSKFAMIFHVEIVLSNDLEIFTFDLNLSLWIK